MSNNPENNVLKSTAERRKKLTAEKEKPKPLEKEISLPKPLEISQKEKAIEVLQKEKPLEVSQKEKPLLKEQETLLSSKEAIDKKTIENEWKSIEQKWSSLKTQSRKKSQTKESNKDAAQRILNSTTTSSSSSFFNTQTPSVSTTTQTTPMGTLVQDLLRSFFPDPATRIDSFDTFFDPMPPRTLFQRESPYPYSHSSLEMLRSRLQQDQSRMSQSVETLVNQIQDVSLRYSQPSRIRGSEGKTLVSGTKPTDENTACPICLETAKETPENNPWRQFPCCKNFIHLECAKQALSKDMRCPMCRKETE